MRQAAQLLDTAAIEAAARPNTSTVAFRLCAANLLVAAMNLEEQEAEEQEAEEQHARYITPPSLPSSATDHLTREGSGRQKQTPTSEHL